MDHLSAARVDVDESALARTWPAELAPNVSDCCAVTDAATGELVMLVAPYPGDIGMFRRACLAMPMSSTYRASGIRNESQVFGYVSRRAVMKREGCRSCAAADSAPVAHGVLVAAAAWLAALFADLHPVQAAADAEVASVVLDDWKLPGSSWTSGVLNRTSALAYHTDANNLPTWSAMVCCRRSVRGGHLHVPAYNLVVPCDDASVVMFPGHRLLHAVTPFVKVRPDGYRFTAVYYAVSAMRHCGPADAELAAARVARTEREGRIAETISPQVGRNPLRS